MNAGGAMSAVGTTTDPIAGTDGMDGNGPEYIFAITALQSLASNQLPLNSWGFDEPGTRNGVTWTDGANVSNLDAATPLLMARRTAGSWCPASRWRSH